MKLLRLKITDPLGFRSLQAGFEVHFLRAFHKAEAGEFNPYILAGPNGSGKSNVFEVLAAIFFHIECMYLNYRPESFEYDEIENPQGFRSKMASPNGFEVEYFIPAPSPFSSAFSAGFGSGPQKHAHIKIVKEIRSIPSYLLAEQGFI